MDQAAKRKDGLTYENFFVKSEVEEILKMEVNPADSDSTQLIYLRSPDNIHNKHLYNLIYDIFLSYYSPRIGEKRIDYAEAARCIISHLRCDLPTYPTDFKKLELKYINLSEKRYDNLQSNIMRRLAALKRNRTSTGELRYGFCTI